MMASIELSHTCLLPRLTRCFASSLFHLILKPVRCFCQLRPLGSTSIGVNFLLFRGEKMMIKSIQQLRLLETRGGRFLFMTGYECPSQCFRSIFTQFAEYQLDFKFMTL